MVCMAGGLKVPHPGASMQSRFAAHFNVSYISGLSRAEGWKEIYASFLFTCMLVAPLTIKLLEVRATLRNIEAPFIVSFG